MYKPPFEQDDQLIEEYSSYSTQARRESTFEWHSAELHFLYEELACPVLDDLDKHIQFFTQKSSKHISPLHIHVFASHQIVIVEDPGLHCIWYYSELYLKPIPDALLNYQFWQDHLCPISPQDPKQPGQDSTQHALYEKTIKLQRAAVGFLRSYAHLIHHKSDFNIAKKNNLIPEDVTYDKFQQFIENFRKAQDTEVSPRWHCGQIRLSRLNWAVRLCRPPSRRGAGFLKNMFYLPPTHWQSGQVLEFMAAPAIAVFAIFSVALSAMQVVLATPKGSAWSAFVAVSWGFAVVVLVVIAVLVAVALAVLGVWWLSQMLFALMYRKPRESGDGGDLVAAT